MPAIVFDRVTLAPGGHTVAEALDLVLPGGQITCLLGASGVGKSTLLRAIAGLVWPLAGAVSGASRGAVGLMTQDDALLPWARPLANIVLGSRLRGERPDKARALHLLAKVGLAGVDRRPDALSGGMRKRVALARLLYEDRPIALLDEPFAALDALTRRDIQALTVRLLAGRTVVLVTHDPFEALSLAGHIVVLHGTPARVGLEVSLPPTSGLRDPADPALRPLYRRVLTALGAAA